MNCVIEGSNFSYNPNSSSSTGFSVMHFQLLLWAIVVWLVVLQQYTSRADTNTFSFDYPDRNALLADGWSFMAITNGVARNTEITDTNIGPMIAYAQTNTALGIVTRIPCDTGATFSTPVPVPDAVQIHGSNPLANSTRNSLFRNLPANWTSLRLTASLPLAQNYQQLTLALYQDDDNYVNMTYSRNSDLATSFGLGAPTVVSLVQEFYGFPNVISAAAVDATPIFLRLDRDVTTENINGFYSLDGTNWVPMGQSRQALTNTVLSIAVGGAQSTFPVGNLVNCDLSEVTIVTSDTYSPPAPILALQPQQLVFNAVQGQPCVATQNVNVILRRDPGPVSWTAGSDSAWLSTSVTNGQTPGSCNVTANTAGLASGTYAGSLSFASGGASNGPVVAVKLIVNPASRVRVATWRNQRPAAMSVSVDDSQLVAFDELSTNGLCGSYLMWHLIAPSAYTNYFQAGMELGAHTVDHPCFNINDPACRYQLESNIMGLATSSPMPQSQIISFAWPCGNNSIEEQVAAADYFLVSRGFNINQLEDPTPNNFMNVKSYNGHEFQPQPPPDLKTVVDAAIAQGKWYNMVLHTINNSDGAIRYASTNNIWVAPLGTVTKYILQRDRTVITNYVENAATVQFNVYRLPLDPSNVRSFETAITSSDLLTLTFDRSGISQILGLTVNGTVTPFTNNGNSFYFTMQVKTTAQTVVVSMSTNTPPVLQPQNNRTMDELTPMTVTNTASDANLPGQTLSYSLTVANILDGSVRTNASISTNGIISWTPLEEHGPSTNMVTTIVTDNGAPALKATNTFSVVVREVNVPPVLPSQGDRVATVQTLLHVTNTASDSDIPVNVLTYTLLSGPTNASISTNGVIFWTPAAGQVLSTNIFMTVVTDTNPAAVNAKQMSATNSFKVVVAAAPPPAPEIQFITVSNQVATIGWSTTAGYIYRLQVTDNLSDTNWSALSTDVLAVGPTTTATNACDGGTQQFYRVLLVP
jgi:hypothetical protein